MFVQEDKLMGEMFKNHGRSRARVLDGNHGIERINYGLSGSVYLPWYYSEAKRGTYYYTRVDGWHRVECPTWLEAFDHIARSRRMLTSKHIGSNYRLEAASAGVELPETVQPKQAATDELTTNDDEGDVEYTVVVHTSDDKWKLELTTYSYSQAQAKFNLIAEQPGDGEKEVAILADGEMDTFLTLATQEQPKGPERDVPTTSDEFDPICEVCRVNEFTGLRNGKRVCDICYIGG
jgi:hypothetical protein